MFAHLVPGVPLLMLCSLLARKWLPRLSLFTLWMCTLALLVLASPVASNFLLSGLEQRYSPVQSAPQDTKVILVLGSGHQYRAGRPHNSVLSATSLSRMTEGIRLWRTTADAVLVTSGAQSYSSTSNAEVSALLAMQQGVPENRIRKFDQARDTHDEIRSAVELLKSESTESAGRLIVVSSATHLARAELMLQSYQIPYTMAPTDFLATDMPWYRLSTRNVYGSDRVLHEYVGMLWHWINS